jgi:putative transposase
MLKAFQYRIYPTKQQQKQLDMLLDTVRRLYNHALAERRDAYQNEGKTLNYYDQANKLKSQRKEDPYLAQLNFSSCQDVLRRLDKAFKAFFRRVKAGEKPGYPRFKGKGRYDSITFPSYGDGCKVKDNRLYLQNVGLLKVKWHRQLEGKIKTVTIRRKVDQWFASFSCEVEPTPLAPCGEAVGIDLGVKHLAITSDGEFYEHPQFLRDAERKLKRKQRAVSRKKKGSNRRRKAIRELARLHAHIANQRKDYAHKVSRKLVNKCGLIAFESLNVQGMVKNHHLAKSIVDASWNQLVQFTMYKAEEAGRRVVLVDPKNTSQLCSNCGEVEPKKLSERVHRCEHCGCVQDRDVNAAQNILKRALA